MIKKLNARSRLVLSLSLSLGVILAALLLSCLTCGIWGWVWLYQVCDRVYSNGARYGVKTICSGSTYLLWGLVGSLICVGPFVACHKMFTDLNNVGAAYNNTLGQAV